MKPKERHTQHIFEDRFIGKRPLEGFSSQFSILKELYSSSPNHRERPCENEAENKEIKNYQALLQNQILGIKDPFTINDCIGNSDIFKGYPYVRNFNLLRNNSKIIDDKENMINETPFICGFSESSMIAPLKVDRPLPKIPYKVLDAPALQDDFYLNVVDWSSQNILAVGLGTSVYLWSSSSGQVTKLNDVGPNDSITSLSWSMKGNYLAVGTYNGMTQIWDSQKCKQIRLLKGHESRVGSLSWNSKILSSGSRDKSILHRDIRQKNNWISQLLGHKQEVCGLKWSFDEQQLCSGGNDNKLLVWSVNNSSQPTCRFTAHVAAVKALAWSPHQHGLLASGGGTADRCLRFWNTLTNSMINCVDTESQVCNIMFSKNLNELVSTHGYSKNAICLWKYPSMRKLTTLTGHTLRVLYLAMSNDGSTIVTGAGDETLRFWNLFPAIEDKSEKDSIFCPDLR